MRKDSFAIACVAALLACEGGCLTEGYEWVPPESDAGIDGAPIDAPVPGAVEGEVFFPGGGGSAPHSGTVRPYAIRAWLYSVDPYTLSREAERSDASFDGDAAQSAPTACPTEFLWPPEFTIDIEPAPNPARFRFDGVREGMYCLVVVKDDMPYFAPGEMPACTDTRTVPPILVRVRPSEVSAPPIALVPPPTCP